MKPHRGSGLGFQDSVTWIHGFGLGAGIYGAGTAFTSSLEMVNPSVGRVCGASRVWESKTPNPKPLNICRLRVELTLTPLTPRAHMWFLFACVMISW